MDVRDIFPELKIEKHLYDDYYKIILRFDNKKSGEMEIRMPRLNPYPEPVDQDGMQKFANSLEDEDKEWFFSRWPYLLEPIEFIGYDWWTDMHITFRGGEKGYDDDIFRFIEKLKLLISVLEEIEQDRDGPDYWHWPDALKPY